MSLFSTFSPKTVVEETPNRDSAANAMREVREKGSLGSQTLRGPGRRGRTSGAGGVCCSSAQRRNVGGPIQLYAPKRVNRRQSWQAAAASEMRAPLRPPLPISLITLLEERILNQGGKPG